MGPETRDPGKFFGVVLATRVGPPQNTGGGKMVGQALRGPLLLGWVNSQSLRGECGISRRPAIERVRPKRLWDFQHIMGPESPAGSRRRWEKGPFRWDAPPSVRPNYLSAPASPGQSAARSPRKRAPTVKPSPETRFPDGGPARYILSRAVCCARV